jgi:cysteine desulfurase
MRIDLDHNATTRVDARAVRVMVAALGETHGNPSSIHEEGRRSRDLVERARAEVAAMVGAGGDVVFTSGGTEADVLGVVGGARAARAAGRPARVVTSPLEHPAVRGAAATLAAEGFEVVEVPVDGAGRIVVAEVARALAPGAALASFALANHERGNVYEVAGFVAAARAAGALVHCDAVQAAGKMPLDGVGADLIAISAHKLHGPKGVGALWVRRGVDLAPLTGAGHQEKGLRPGTENVAGIAGFAEAARLARSEGPAAWPRIAALRDRLEAAAVRAGARVHGDRARRVVNTTNLAFDGVPGDLLVQALDLEGVSASTGAACTSGTVEPSPVVRALGVPREHAAEAVRFSLGRDNTEEEIARVAEMLPRLVERIRTALG